MLKILASLGWLQVALLRWINAAGVVLSAIVAACLARRLWQRPEVGPIAFSLYLLHPIVVQGTQSLDMADASFFPAIFGLWILGFLSGSRSSRDWSRWGRLALLSALTMGWKTTSSLGLLFFPVLAIFWKTRNERHLANPWGDLVATLAGFLTFSFAWSSLQAWVTLDASAETAVTGIVVRLFKIEPARLFFHTTLGLAWLGPFLIALALWGALKLIQRDGNLPKVLLAGITLYGLGYLLVGGMNYAFPRYHVAVLPILCSLASGIASLRNWKSSLGILALMTTFFYLVQGDPIHALNVTIREALLAGTLSSDLLGEAARWVVWIAIPAGVAITWNSRLKFLLLCSLAGSLSLGVLQSLAPYTTSYAYGARGRSQVLDWVAENSTPGSVLCPPDLSADIRERGFQGPGHMPWRTRETLLDYVQQEWPRVVLLSLTENMVSQLQWLLQDPPEELETCRDRYLRIGTYWACLLPDSQAD